MGEVTGNIDIETGSLKRKKPYREIFVAALLLLVGLVYCILFVQSLVSAHSRSSAIGDEVISLNKSELFSDIKTIATIFCSVTGGIGILRVRKTGWILGFAQLIILMLITAAGWKQIIHLNITGSSFVIVLTATVLLITSIIFLNLQKTRQRFGIKPKTYLVTTGVAAVLFLIFFVLQ